MIGTARAASVGEDQDGFHAVHERLGLGEIGACAASFELLGTVATDHNAARPASHLRDARGPEVRQQSIQRGRHGRHGAEFLDQCIASRNRSEEHTSELQSLMRISYAVFCLKKTTNTK